MSKFTDIQKGYLKQFVGDCVMNRFSTEESLLYLKDRLGVELEEDEFNYLKSDLKRDLKRNIEYLRRHENAYIQEYFDRIEEIRLIHKRLWKLVEENPHNPILQKDCLSELCKSTIAIADFYRSIKELDQASATMKEEPSMISASSLESEATPAPKAKSGEALKEEPSMISASSLESEATLAPKAKSGEALKEESEMIRTISPETTPTPPKVEPSEAMKEESEMIRTISPETTPTPTPEVEIPQQYTPKKISKYTSEGKLVTVGG